MGERAKHKTDWRQEVEQALWRRPLVGLALLYMLGWLAATAGSWIGLAALGGGLALLIGNSRNRGVVLLAGGVIAAVGLWQWGQLKDRPEVGKFAEQAVVLRGVVAQEPRPGSTNQNVLLTAEQLSRGGVRQPVRGELWLFVPAGVKLRYLDVLKVTGELRAPGLGKRNGRPWLVVGDGRLIQKLGHRPEGLIAAAGRRVRVETVEVLAPLMPQGYQRLNAQLLTSLFFGTAGAGLPKEVVELFRRTGTIHLLVVSGSQISLLFLLVYFPGMLAFWQGRRALRRELWAADYPAEAAALSTAFPTSVRGLPTPGVIGAGLVLMVSYALLTQGGSSIARAAVMAGLIGLALLLRHIGALADRHSLEVDHYTLLGAAALGILLVDPTALGEVGFQLSFAAVWGLIFLSPKLQRLLGFLPDFWGYLIGGTVAAQLATLPIVAWQFGSAPIIGFLSNLIVMPVAALLLWLGLATLVLRLALWPLAVPLGWLCGQLCWLLVQANDWFGKMPGGMVELKRLSWWGVAIYLIILGGAGIWLGKLAPVRQDEFAGLADTL